jgi:hypothetical protein
MNTGSASGITAQDPLRTNDMENPGSWGEAEKIIDAAHKKWWGNRDKGKIGLSLPRQIADALRDAGLLNEDA